jgi:hypothetical protein
MLSVNEPKRSITSHVWNEAKTPVNGLTDYGEILTQSDREAPSTTTDELRCLRTLAGSILKWTRRNTWTTCDQPTHDAAKHADQEVDMRLSITL